MKTEKISFHDMFYTFLFGCVFGWIIEGIWTLIKKGVLINHTALVIGPFNLVYGIGSVILTIILYRLKNKGNFEIFCVSFATGSILEYIMSYLMEVMFGFVAWNYKRKPFNINGRICLTYSIFWGILGILWIKVIYPRIKVLIDKLNKKNSVRLMKYMIIFLIFDAILTLSAIDRGKKYEQNIPPSNKYEEILDEYFGVDYLNNMFNERWNKK